jgi:hypothetical protein
MSGGNKSLVKVTLRNPLDKRDQITYTIEPFDTQLSRDWIKALKQLLSSRLLLEKNYCFLGFPGTQRNLQYLCDELNQAVYQVNKFTESGAWRAAGLDDYMIEEWFSPDTVRYNTGYLIPVPGSSLEIRKQQWGLRLKRDIMNRIHNHFERLQGTVWNLSPYYQTADDDTKYAIRQLNNLCHEIENLVLSQRKQIADPDWIRPNQITTWLSAPRLELTDEHRKLFVENKYDRKFGTVYMHWTQIGKTLFEVWRDENAPDLTVGDDPTDISVGSGITCEAITALKFYSGEFDVEWAKSVGRGGETPWHDVEQEEFNAWLIQNNIDNTNPKLSLGYLPLGQVCLLESFGTTDEQTIWNTLEQYLDIYCIEVDGVQCKYDYVWSDPDYKQMQIDVLKPGYNYWRTKNAMD